MAIEFEKFQGSFEACVANARRLVEDAEWSTNRASTGLALALLAQEEFAKAFLLSLVRDGILPWTEEVRGSLRDHCSKQLVTIIMEWLSAIEEIRMDTWSAEYVPNSPESTVVQLPDEVAKAVNIYRHEVLERFAGRGPYRFPEWDGLARRIAKGQRERKKQAALYVGIAEDGSVSSQPPVNSEDADAEILRAKVLGDSVLGYVFSRQEYGLLVEVVKAVFHDLIDEDSEKEVCDGVIPGVRFVRRSITCATTAQASPDDGESD
jgi:AbiV family abortive infection protein